MPVYFQPPAPWPATPRMTPSGRHWAARWHEALVSVNSLLLGPWIEALRPVRGKLTAPLATIFQDKSRPETVHSLATDILADYASDDPDRLAELLMVADPEGVCEALPGRREAGRNRSCLFFQAELAKKATYSWNDPPLDPSWTKPDAALVSRIESAQGMLAERFAFCQTMPLDEFSRRPPWLSANRDTAPCGSAPTPMGRQCESRRSGPVMGETGESLPV